MKGKLNEEIKIKKRSLSYMNINANNTYKIIQLKIINSQQNLSLSDKIIIPKNQNCGTIAFSPELE